MTTLPTLKADLHVHSFFSGYTGHLPFFRTRDCYSTPEEIYRAAKARGMDLVAITDHDSIDGCLEFLDAHPDATDFIVGEEIECMFPDTNLAVHVGAYGIDERIHREIQPLRRNVFEVAAYLRKEGVPFSLNHLFHFFRGQVELRDYVERLVDTFMVVEARNGTMLREHNHFIRKILREYRRQGSRFAEVGGSDSHALGRIATTYTEAPGRNRAEFLESIRKGNARAVGLHGNVPRLAGEIYSVIFNYFGSLLNLRPHELTWSQQAGAIGFSLLSLPFQWVPLAVALGQKWGEAARIARWQRSWENATEEMGLPLQDPA